MGSPGALHAAILMASASSSIARRLSIVAVLGITRRVRDGFCLFGSVIRGELAERLPCLLLLISLVSPAIVIAPTEVYAAPITGSNQASPPPGEIQTPESDPAKLEALGDPDAMIIEFSVLPSESDPNKLETTITVHQTGGARVCVDQSVSDVITRSYRARGDEPFTPSIPAVIRGLNTDNTGDLIGYNDFNVFIRPHGPDDEFSDADECFTAGDAEGCFLPEAVDCDQFIEAGEIVRVGEVIGRFGFSATDHANLIRQLKILVVLNQPLEEAPIIVAADIEAAPEITELPTGPAPEAAPPAAEVDVPVPILPGEDTGGGGELLVPPHIGLTVQNAIAVLASVGLPVRIVTVNLQVSSLDNGIIRSARAQELVTCNLDDCTSEEVSSAITTDSTCPFESPVLDHEFCDITARGSRAIAAIPEPATLHLFAVGLLLLGLITWWRRRRY